MSPEEMLIQIEQALTEAEEQKALLTVELKRVEQARNELEKAEAHQLTGSMDALKERIAQQPELEAQLQRVNERIASLQERRTALVESPSA